MTVTSSKPCACLLILAWLLPSGLALYSCPPPCKDSSDALFARNATEGTALDKYVAAEDAAYEWQETGRVLHGVLPFSTWTGHVLRMTSQRWLTAADTSCSEWSHDLVLIVPGNLHYTKTAVLLISQGSNTDPPPTSFDSFVLMAAALAVKTRSMAAVLYQVPNQPCTLASDPSQSPLGEDDLIAFTWRHVLDHPSEVEWLARFPMVKAAVRGMDTVQAYARALRGAQVASFTVMGASKRGWTAWLTAAVDKRVTCLVPIVLPLLNIQPNLHHTYRSVGGWPFTFEPYYARNITRDLDTPQMEYLFSLIDASLYADRLTMPKLVVTASQDEFFMIDDTRFFWDSLPGELHALLLANTEHSLITGIPKLVPAVAAFHLSVMDSILSKRGQSREENFEDRGKAGEPQLEDLRVEEQPLSSDAEEWTDWQKAGERESFQKEGEGRSFQKEGDRGSFPNEAERKSLVEKGRDTEETEQVDSWEGESTDRMHGLCGSFEELKAVYGSLLDDSRPWGERWREAILKAFGPEDCELWRESEEFFKHDAALEPGERALLDSDRLWPFAVRDEDGSVPTLKADGFARAELMRAGGNTEAKTLETGFLSIEEDDVAREWTAQVRARERALLRAPARPSVAGGPGRARPKYRYSLHRSEGKIRIFCNDVPQTIIQWSAYTPDCSDRRDFRFVARSWGNCSTFKVAGGCVQAFCFSSLKLKPSGPNLGDGLQYEASLPAPKQGFGAFFVEMRWRGLWNRPLYVFTTPALVVPDTYPFKDCQGECCKGRLV